MKGRQLTITRKLRGKTQTDLARAVGLSQKSISKFEKEECDPSEETLKALAKELEFDIRFFSKSGTEPPKPEAISFRARSKMSRKTRIER